MSSSWICFVVFTFSLFIELLSGSLFHDTENGPFTCSGKVIGGYYADVQEKCQMFHVCTIGVKGEIRDIVFRCLNGTVFDQETRVCEREEEVDCSQTLSFYHLNNELYGPGIIPSTASSRITGGSQTVTQKDSQTTDSCDELNYPTLISDPNSGCRSFFMCVQTQSQKMIKREFKCAQKGFILDGDTGLCSLTVSKCESSRSILPSFRMIDPLHVCSLMPVGAFVVDQLTNCQQYYECPLSPSTPINTRSCESGFVFSQRKAKCISADNLNCQNSVQELYRHLSLLDHVISQNKLKSVNILEHMKRKGHYFNSLRRARRAIVFESGNPHRVASNGPLTNVAGIFGDHSSVIDSQSHGNVLDRKLGFPVFPTSSKNQNTTPVGPIFKRPKTMPRQSLAVNKTFFNGTIFEISEIAAPDQSGKVTITSIVPKFVKQNGNGNNKSKKENPLNEAKSTVNEEIDTGNSTNEEAMNVNVTETTVVTEDPVTEISQNAVETTEYQASTETTTTSAPTTTPSPVTTTTTTATTTSISSSSIPPTKPNDRISDDTVNTNFTCKDKELERFYPDFENECRSFHYCSPGFSEDEVLDLTFVCSGDSKFDITSKKCEDLVNVTCGESATTTQSSTTTTTSTTTTSTSQPPLNVTTISSKSTANTTNKSSTSEFYSTSSIVTTSDIITSTDSSTKENVQTWDDKASTKGPPLEHSTTEVFGDSTTDTTITSASSITTLESTTIQVSEEEDDYNNTIIRTSLTDESVNFTEGESHVQPVTPITEEPSTTEQFTTTTDATTEIKSVVAHTTDETLDTTNYTNLATKPTSLVDQLSSHQLINTSKSPP